MKHLLLIFFACVSFSASAQQNDFFLLKKQNGKTLKSFYKGTYIGLITVNKDHHSGYIKKIARDSVWIEYQQVLTSVTIIGSSLSDTITYEARRFAINDIAYIEKEERGFNQAVPSALLKIGGAGYIVLHTFNGLYQKDKISIRNIGIAAGAYLAGILINKLKKDYYYVGKRFRIQYVSLMVNTAE